MASNRNYDFDEIRRIALQRKFAGFKIDDGKEFHTVDEIRQAAIDQGLIEPPESTVYAPGPSASAPDLSTQNQAGKVQPVTRSGITPTMIPSDVQAVLAQNPVTDPATLANNQASDSALLDAYRRRSQDNKKLNQPKFSADNYKLPGLQEMENRFAQNAYDDYLKSLVGSKYIKDYTSDTPSSTVQGDIDHLSVLKYQAEEQGNTESASYYDRAVNMLKQYANQRYSLEGTDPEYAQDRQQRYKDNEEKIKSIDKEIAKAKSDSKTYEPSEAVLSQWNDYRQHISDDVINEYIQGPAAKIKDLETQKKALQNENNTYRRNHPEEFLYSYEELRSEPDFEENSKRKETHGKRGRSASDKLSIFSDGYNNDDVDTSDDTTYGVLTEGEEKSWRALYKKEKDIYYYLLNKQGEDAAYKYLDLLAPVLQKRETRWGQEDYQATAETMRDTFHIPGSLALAPLRIAGGISSAVNDLGSTLRGEEINPYNSAHYLTNVTDAVMESDVKAIDEATNGASLFGFTVGDAYQGLYSMYESTLLTVLTTPAVAAGIMSTEAAQAKATELYNRGATNEQITEGAISAGIFEYVFEKVSLDTIVNKVIAKNATKEGIAKYIATGLASAGIEGSEEVNTDIANYVADQLIMRDQSERQTLINQYKEQGYSEEQATKKANEAFKQSLYESFMGGAVGGAAGGASMLGAAAKDGVSNIKNGIDNVKQRNQYISQTGAAIEDAGNTQELIDRARQVDDTTKEGQKIQKQADKLSDLDSKQGTGNRFTNWVNDKRTTKATGKLHASMQENAVTSANSEAETLVKDALKEAYASRTNENINAKSVQLASDAMYKVFTGQELTASEYKKATNATARAALEEVRNNTELKDKLSNIAEQARYKMKSNAALTLTEEQRKQAQKQTPVKNDADVDIGEYNVHEDDGKVYTADGSEQVNIKADTPIASIGSNGIVLNTESGTKENAKNLDLPVQKAVLVQSVLDVQKDIPITTGIANELYKGYESIEGEKPSISQYMDEAKTALFNGYSGNDVSNDNAILPRSLRDNLYKLGSDLVETHTQEQQETVKSRMSTTDNHREGKVTFVDGINKNRLDARRYAGYKVMEAEAKATGTDVVFYRSTKDSDGKWRSQFITDNNLSDSEDGQAPEGFWKDGKLYIDINSGLTGNGLILFTAAHEMTHMMKDGALEHWKAYADFIVENYVKQGTDVDRLIKNIMLAYPKLTYPQAYEEMICRASEGMLRDTHLNEKAAAQYKQNRTLWEKIKDIFSKLVSLLKKGGYDTAQVETEEARLVSKFDTAAIEKAQDLWLQGKVASAENLRNMDSVPGDGVVKYDARKSFSEQVDDVIENKHNPRFDLFVRETPEYLLDLNFTDGPLLMRNSKVYETLSKHPEVSETIIKSIPELLDDPILVLKSKTHPKESVVVITDYLTQKGDLIIPIWVNQEGNYIDIDLGEQVLNTNFVASAYGRSIKGLIEYANENDGFLYQSTDIEKVRQLLARSGLQLSTPLKLSDSDIIVPQTKQNSNTSTKKNKLRTDADYLSAVNSGDMETAQKMVDEAAERAFDNSKVRDEKGKLIKVYRGTAHEFNVFDKKLIGKNYGEERGDTLGFYFTPYLEDARGYASNVSTDKSRQRIITGFLNLKNPLVIRDSGWGDAATQADIRHHDLMRWAKEGKHDGIIVESVDEEDSIYIAFNSEQIKSADPVTYDDNGNVIPLSERFNTAKKDIRYKSRVDNGFDLDADLFEDDDSIENIFAKEYVTHHEDIGEVLKNISDIELAPKKVESIINRIIRDNLGDIDAETRKTLSTELQLAMEWAGERDTEQVSNEMIAAVRKAIDNATVNSDYAEDNYNDFLSAFKGKRFYLTEEQIADLKEHDMTLGDFKNAMMGKFTVVKAETAERSISGGIKNAQELSLEGLYESLEHPEEYLPYKRGEWDQENYHAPIIIMETLNELKSRQSVPLTEMANAQDIDDIAVGLTAKITGAVVEAKYNSRKNPYVSNLVDNLKEQRKAAIEKQKAKNREKLKELKAKERERAEKREAELRKKYTEQRERGYENRKRTEFRGKIRKLMSSFQSRLTKPHDGSYVPRELISQTVDILNTINMDTGRSAILSEKIAALRNTYDGLQKDAEAYAVYDKTISDMLQGLSESIKGVSIMDMSLDQLKQTYDTLRSLDHYIRESVRMTDTEFKATCHEYGRQLISETSALPTHSGPFSYSVQSILSSERFFKRLAGFKKDSVWETVIYKMLNDGQLKTIQLQMEFSQIFSDLYEDVNMKEKQTLSEKAKKYVGKPQVASLFSTKEQDLVDVGLKDSNGNPIRITRGMMLSLYMHLLNEDNTRHVSGSSLTVPDLEDYYNGQTALSYGEGRRSANNMVSDVENGKGASDSEYIQGMKSKIEKRLTEYDIKWIEAAQYFFDVASKNAINDTTMKLYGFKKATVDHYFPIHTDPTYRDAKFEDIQRDMSLENWGSLKERVHASNPILLEDIVDVINEQIKRVSQYCGMVIPIKNFQKVYNTTLNGYGSSVKTVLDEKFSATKGTKGANDYIKNLIADLSTDRKGKDTGLDHVINAVRRNTAKATLTLNVSTSFAQAGSIPTAAAVIGWKPIRRAMAHDYFMVTDTEIAEVTPLFWLRRQGYATTEIGDINDLRKHKHQIQRKAQKAIDWISAFDSFAVRRIYVACKYYMQDHHSDLKPGTDEYKQKLSEIYNKCIEDTQPNYTVMQRPDILRDPSTMKKTLTMFMTQRLQNFNIVYDAAGTYIRYHKDYKNNRANGVTLVDLRQARSNFWRAVASQIVASMTISAFKFLSGLLLYAVNPWRDKDEELTLKSVSLGILETFADTMLGNVLFGSDLFKLFEKFVFGKRYYGISMTGVDGILDLIDMVQKGFVKDGKLSWDAVNNLAKSICTLGGVPLSNAEKIAKAIYYWGSDIVSGDPFSFEAGVERTAKQNIHRAETRIQNGETKEAKDILNVMMDEYQQRKEGRTHEDAVSWLKGELSDVYKQRYIDAKNDERIEIRKTLWYTGVYKSLPKLDETLDGWLEDIDSKDAWK